MNGDLLLIHLAIILLVVAWFTYSKYLKYLEYRVEDLEDYVMRLTVGDMNKKMCEASDECYEQQKINQEDKIH